jgi:hypothetical protein
MVLTQGKHIQAHLVSQFDFFYQVLHTLVCVHCFTRDPVGVNFCEGAYAEFHSSLLWFEAKERLISVKFNTGSVSYSQNILD